RHQPRPPQRSPAVDLRVGSGHEAGECGSPLCEQWCGGGGVKEIDFLPQSFHQLARRRRIARGVLGGGAVLTALPVLHGLVRRISRFKTAAPDRRANPLYLRKRPRLIRPTCPWFRANLRPRPPRRAPNPRPTFTSAARAAWRCTSVT